MDPTEGSRSTEFRILGPVMGLGVDRNRVNGEGRMVFPIAEFPVDPKGIGGLFHGLLEDVVTVDGIPDIEGSGANACDAHRVVGNDFEARGRVGQGGGDELVAVPEFLLEGLPAIVVVADAGPLGVLEGGGVVERVARKVQIVDEVGPANQDKSIVREVGPEVIPNRLAADEGVDPVAGGMPFAPRADHSSLEEGDDVEVVG